MAKATTKSASARAKPAEAGATPKPTRRKKAPAGPIGLSPAEVKIPPPPDVEYLGREIETDGGAVLSAYRDPLGGHWLILAVLPLDQVEPTPYQRNLSEAHVRRLADVIARTGRYLDPVVAVRVAPQKYQVPNGHHRASALKLQGARSITALVVTEPEVARLILALNVEKAHNLREKSLEVMKLARELATLPNLFEHTLALEFEEPAFLTLGLCYDQRGRFGGGAYHPILKRVDAFLRQPLADALRTREAYAARILELDDTVTALVNQLKEQGLESPYLRNFVVARLNPLRFRRGATLPFDETLNKMSAAAAKFTTGKITPADLARTGGAPPDTDG